MRVSLSLPEHLAGSLDAAVRAKGYTSRSAAVREALEDFLQKHRRLAELRGDVTAVVTFSYPHGRGMEERVTGLQHRHGALVTSTSHVHRGERCLEVVFLQGVAHEVRSFVEDLSRLKRVGHVVYALGEGGQGERRP